MKIAPNYSFMKALSSIQSTKCDTRVYTPGTPILPQPLPNDVTPTTLYIQSMCSCLTCKGPPESPLHVSFFSYFDPAHNCESPFTPPGNCFDALYVCPHSPVENCSNVTSNKSALDGPSKSVLPQPVAMRGTVGKTLVSR